ncbi:unnamed protein product [Ambrosiozyma monospora]|uniref:Unnamed protein product n=1 Tax=Ambrosiozyma monospora TaxID=43982 RepID=A0ACB5SUY2_AMBMO|nr:unnamed protein product [Ambrosiozyma monospora]
MVAFCVLFAVDEKKATAGSIFASLAWFTAMSQSFMVLPVAVAIFADASVGFGRLCEFFSQPEIKLTVWPFEDEHSDKYSLSAIKITDASFNWENFDDEESEPSNETETEINKEEKCYPKPTLSQTPK